MEVPLRLRETCARNAAAGAWLEKLPSAVAELERRWSLRTGKPFEGGTYSWVAPAERADGTSAVLKVALPHFEADHESDGAALLERRTEPCACSSPIARSRRC